MGNKRVKEENFGETLREVLGLYGQDANNDFHAAACKAGKRCFARRGKDLGTLKLGIRDPQE